MLLFHSMFACVFVVILGVVFSQKSAQECTDYYSGFNLAETNQAQMVQSLHNLIKDHNIIPYSSDETDVWDALKELDANPNNPNELRLMYTNTYVPLSERDGFDNLLWNREHVWPKSYGVGSSGPDTSDVHNLRPCDVNVNSFRGHQYFDECDGCSQPTNTAVGTKSDGTRYTPPDLYKGIVARTFFYMDVRYTGADSNTENLMLGECICEPAHRMGNLKTLIQWHKQFPPTQEEITRNQLVCTKFQGNKNPFVDHPDLVDVVYADYLQDDSCSTACAGQDPTPSPPTTSTPGGAPTTSPPPPGSTELNPGDVSIIGFSVEKNEVALVTNVNIAAGVGILITDHGFNGIKQDFRANEGVLRYIVPEGGIVKGQLLFANPSSWEKVGNGNFALSAKGDSVIAYTQSGGKNTYLYALGIKIQWVTTDVGDSNDSALPNTLDPAKHSVLIANNFGYYNGTRRAENMDSLKTEISTPANWIALSSDPAGAGLEELVVGGFKDETAAPTVSPTTAAPTLCPPVHKWEGPEVGCVSTENRGYSTSVQNFCISLFGVNVSIAIIFLCWTLLNRNEAVVRASQVPFLAMISVGTIISSFTILLIIVDDSGDVEGLSYTGDYTYANILCMLQPWFYVTGFTITFCPLFAKLWRIHRIFNNRSFRRINISNTQLFAYIGALLLVDWTIVGIWTAKDPLIYVRRGIGATAGDEYPQESVGRCVCENAIPYVAAVLSFHLLILAFGVRLCYQTRKISTDFQEGKYVSIAMVSNLQVLALGIPVLVFFNDVPLSSMFISGFVLFLNDFTTSCLIYIPKIIAWIRNEDIVISSNTKTSHSSTHENSQSRLPLRFNKTEDSSIESSGLTTTVASSAFKSTTHFNEL